MVGTALDLGPGVFQWSPCEAENFDGIMVDFPWRFVGILMGLAGKDGDFPASDCLLYRRVTRFKV